MQYHVGCAVSLLESLTAGLCSVVMGVAEHNTTYTSDHTVSKIRENIHIFILE